MQKDNLQSAIRLIREVGSLAESLSSMISRCNTTLENSLPIKIFIEWTQAFKDRASYDYKIFKSVSKNFKSIQTEVRQAREAYSKEIFSEVGASLARIEIMVVGSNVP